jgi:prepilin-type N-terminal cleavage/methylation domain-containing protein
MNCRATTTHLKKFPGNFRRPLLAFTLIEMLVVITIILLLAGLGLPALKGFGESNAMTAATRQVMDDLSFARLKAINSRSTVYVVFIPPEIVTPAFLNSLTPAQRNEATKLFSGQYTSYALFTRRQVGEQPGRDNPRYLTAWKTLPDKVFFATAKFVRPPPSRFSATYSETNRPFATNEFPFPTAAGTVVHLPYVAFNSQGWLISEEETDSSGATLAYHSAVIPLARGSIFYARDADGNLIAGAADAIETPPQNSINNFNNIRIDWLTGRTRVERKEFQ